MPVPEGFGFGGIQNHPRDIERATFWFGNNLMVTKAFVAPSGQLPEGHRGFGSAGEIKDSVGGGKFLGEEDLVENERGQVAWVEAVADLMPFSIEADVAEWSPAEMAVDPVGEDALVRAAELARAGHDAAAVDENREAKCLPVFQREHFAGEFRGSVEGDGWLRGKSFVHSRRGETGRPCLGGKIGHEGVVLDLHGKIREGWDRINSAGAEQDKGGLAGFAEFEQVDCAKEVVFDQLARAGFSIHSSQNTWIRGGVNERINFWNPFQITGGADVAVEDFDSNPLEFRPVRLATGADEIVDSEDFQIGPMSQQGFGQRAANETANACD